MGFPYVLCVEPDSRYSIECVTFKSLEFPNPISTKDLVQLRNLLLGEVTRVFHDHDGQKGIDYLLIDGSEHDGNFLAIEIPKSVENKNWFTSEQKKIRTVLQDLIDYDGLPDALKSHEDL